MRLLANIETPTDKLLPIVLAGQPELADRLNQPSLRQLKQRVALRCSLEALDPRRPPNTLPGAFEWRAAAVCSSSHVRRWRRSSKVPAGSAAYQRDLRRSLISGFAADRRPVSREIVDDVCRDFDLQGKKKAEALTGAAAVASAAPGSPGCRACRGPSRRRRRACREKACSSILVSAAGSRF